MSDPAHDEPARTPRAIRIAVVVLVLYLVGVVLVRVLPSLRPWSAETDWKQWLWIYHRFSTPGAFPPGQLLTDYAFVVQPPGYLAVAAALSWLLSPIGAATVLYTVALIGAIVCAWWASAARIPPAAALLAAVVVAHGHAFFRHTIGGYPRSFGPMLTLLFLAAWMNKRPRLVLLSLVLMAAVYPSVVVPCGLAYGAWSVLLAARDGWLKRNLALAATGAVVIVLSLSQSLLAPSWWGSVVTLAEAESMPALGPEGRTPWVPMPGYWERVLTYLTAPFEGDGGILPAFGVAPWAPISEWLILAFALVCIGVLVQRARRDGASWREALRALPLEPALLMGGALLAFLLARVLAFKLYLPHRVVQHVLPYATAVFVVIVIVRAIQVLVPRPARALEVAAIWAPFAFLIVAGDGLLPIGLRTYREDAPLYTWVEEHTPIDAQLAGNLKILDELPFFAKRQAYVNWKMAHPFRKGFYAEIERRILAMYDAYYATEVGEILAFAEREKITHFVVDTSLFIAVESGDGQLFEPLRAQVLEVWRARRGTGFVFLGLPDEVVAFRHGSFVVVEVAALRAWAAAHPGENPRATPVTRIGAPALDVPRARELEGD